MPEKNEVHICSICGGAYFGFGNNAQPFTGRCCDECNTLVVIPARLMQMQRRWQHEEENKNK